MDYEYVVVNFYDETFAARTFVSIYDLAQGLFDKDVTQHQAKVGFAQANIELYPDLAWTENTEPLPIQVIFTHNQLKTINFKLEAGEKAKDSAQRFATDIHAMTGTYL